LRPWRYINLFTYLLTFVLNADDNDYDDDADKEEEEEAVSTLEGEDIFVRKLCKKS